MDIPEYTVESLTNTVPEFKLIGKGLAAQPEAFALDGALLKPQELPKTLRAGQVGEGAEAARQNGSHLTHALVFF